MRKPATTSEGTMPGFIADQKVQHNGIQCNELHNITPDGVRPAYQTGSQVDLAAQGPVSLESGITKTCQIEQHYSPWIKEYERR